MPLSGAAPKRIQTCRARDPSIPLGGSTYSLALLPLSSHPQTARVMVTLFETHVGD
ncbi:hypothetical protein E2C01_058494 [Portunus trituberculatus]|uniref:Uncharacterized protein n=1 Tax=Portunus trituberculatus TaxID=210409 RepID=A0A5B7GWL4_PORTR|nr:hypothetical protein [Portunus trituberculatus]